MTSAWERSVEYWKVTSSKTKRKRKRGFKNVSWEKAQETTELVFVSG